MAPGAYDEVRRKLVERGYLDGRIERFVLRDSGLSRAGLRAALLGGPLLGGLLAASAAAANRPLLGPIDLLVLWLYFSVLASAFVFVLDLAAAAVVAHLARRRGARGADSLRASLLVALPTLVYLVLIWWWKRPGPGLRADALFLVAAIAATLFVAWLAGLVSLAGVIGRTGQVPDRKRGPVLALVVVLLPVAAATLLVASLLASGDGRPVPPAPFEVASTTRVIFVGVDGLDASLLESLAEKAEVAELLERGKRGSAFPLRRAPGSEPAEVWTTLMTGMRPEEHGVRGAGAERVRGVGAPLRRDAGPALLMAALRFVLPARTVPTTGASRGVRTLWEILGLKEEVAAVGFWASWPAREPGDDGPSGYVVSDRVLPKLLAGRENDRDASPASLYEALAARFPAERTALHAEFDASFPALDERVRRVAWESFLIDAYHARTSRLLAQDERVRASFTYLPGLDILRVRLETELDGSDAPSLVAVSRVLESYVAWLSRLLVRLPADGGFEVSILVADPGRTARDGDLGFVSVLGSSARAGCEGGTLTDLDVAPLVLALAGYPRSRELPGRAPERCIAAPAPRAEVSSFGRRGRPPDGGESEYDRDMLERLRSLGYVR